MKRVLGSSTAPRAGFWSNCWVVLVAGTAVRLLLAPFTSVNLDVKTWSTAVRQAIKGIPLYSQPGFSYPPVWGYVLHAEGFFARLAGFSPLAVASSPRAWALLSVRDWQYTPEISTPLATLCMKLPLICSDVVVAWLLWQLVLSLGLGMAKAKIAVALWFLCPLVVFETSVHGAFDTLVALTIAAALLARVRRHYFLAGAAVALGVLTKLTPGFIAPLLLATCLWPMPGEESTSRRRAVMLLMSGAGAALALGLAPLVFNGTLHDAYTNVFARASVASSVGGVSWLGFSDLPAFSSVASWALQPANAVVKVSALFDFVPAVAAAFLWRRTRRDEATLLALVSLVMAMVLVDGPLANPQYFLWLLPPVIVLAVESRAVRVMYWVLGVGGLIYELAIVSPLGLLSPAYLAFGIPSVHEMVAAPLAMTATTLFGVPLGKLLEFSAFVATMAAVGILCWALRGTFIGRRRVRTLAPSALPVLQASDPVGGSHRFTTGKLRLLCASILGVPLVFGLPPAAFDTKTPPPRLEVQMSAPSHRVLVKWSGAARLANAPLNVLITPTPERVRSVYVYDDPAYPSSGSSAFAVVGVAVHLPIDLAAVGVRVPVHVIDAVRLATVLSDVNGAPGTVVVDPAGTLPKPVWAPGTDLVAPFLKAGGTLVWGGDLPGYYSVGQAPSMDAYPSPAGKPNVRCGRIGASPGPPLAGAVTVMGPAGVAQLLGLPHLLGMSWGWGCTALRPSAAARALALASVAVHGGPLVSTLRTIGGAALGYEVLGRTSIAWIPRGNGGILLFSGEVNPTSMAQDTASLLAVGGAKPDISVVRRIRAASSGSVSIAGPKGACVDYVALAVVDPTASVFFAHRSIVDLCGVLSKEQPVAHGERTPR